MKQTSHCQKRDQETHLGIFQTEIRHSTHGSGFTFGQILVDLIDSFRDMIVSLVEEIASLLLDS